MRICRIDRWINSYGPLISEGSFSRYILRHEPEGYTFTPPSTRIIELPEYIGLLNVTSGAQSDKIPTSVAELTHSSSGGTAGHTQRSIGT